MRILLEAFLGMIAVIAAVAAVYGFVLGSWQHGSIELVIAVLAGWSAHWVRTRRLTKKG